MISRWRIINSKNEIRNLQKFRGENKKVSNLLEYNKIIDPLPAQAGSELARERIEGFVPTSNMDGYEHYGNYGSSPAILYKGSIPVGEIDIRGLLDIVRKGRSLSMRELLLVNRSLAGKGS